MQVKCKYMYVQQKKEDTERGRSINQKRRGKGGPQVVSDGHEDLYYWRSVTTDFYVVKKKKVLKDDYQPKSKRKDSRNMESAQSIRMQKNKTRWIRAFGTFMLLTLKFHVHLSAINLTTCACSKSISDPHDLLAI